MRPSVVIMAKEPVMGRVKTRLGNDIGPVAATYFYRHAAKAVMLRLARDPRWQVVLSLSPDRAVTTRTWPLHLARARQGTGDLGARMQRIFDEALPGPVLIMGTDIPQVRPTHLAQALRLLGSHDAVLGSAGDGGFWLVGQTSLPRILRPFDNVRWSSVDTLNDTIGNLNSLSVGFAATLADVDNEYDYRKVRAWSGRVVLPMR